MESLRASSLISFFAVLALGCGSDDATSDPETGSGTLMPGMASLPDSASDAIATYADIVQRSYEDALSSARGLDVAANAFTDAPSAAAQTRARDAWRAAREPYLQTEVYRFYGGPIDDEDSGPELLINAWPLDERHIDYVEGEPDAGIINDPTREISTETLLAANLNPGETDVATGYHAIEFLLWGQDFDDAGPGQRPFTDYVPDAAQPNAERRAQYLTTSSELLVGHLQELEQAWASGASGNYRSSFEGLDPEDAFSRIMSGMIILSGFELADERLSAALDAQDQEEEHSCFSDNTHRDMVQNVRGIQNVWLGSYEPLEGATISGTGVRDVIADGDADLADDITDQIAESLRLAEALQRPFDREIAADNPEGNARVDALIEALSDQEELLEQAFVLYGLNRIPDPT
jgi:putative iron-regulated protein